MKIHKHFAALCLLVLPLLASAQFTQKGTTELGGDISFSSQKEGDDDESLTTFSMNPYIGFMLNDGLELGFRPQLMTISYGGPTLTTIGLFIAPAYNFNTGSNIYPYVEFLIGYNSISNDDDSFGGLGIGGDAGMKVNLKGNSLLLVKLEYLNQNYDQDGDSFSLNTLSFGVGFRVFFERSQTAK